MMSQPVVFQDKQPATIELRSNAFGDGDEIPTKYTGDGEDRSPELEWSNVPAGAKELAIVCEDPDAPGGTYVHWVVYGIPPATSQLPEGIPPIGALNRTVQAMQGKNSAGTTGYEGPMPPKGHGWHHYYFRIYALDQEVPLQPGATREQLDEQMRGHIIGEGVIMGRYKREAARKAA